jgi:hypothetical protein
MQATRPVGVVPFAGLCPGLVSPRASDGRCTKTRDGSPPLCAMSFHYLNPAFNFVSFVAWRAPPRLMF